MLFVFALFVGATIEYSIIAGLFPGKILVWISLGTAYVVAVGWLFVSKCHFRRYNYETWQ